LVTVDHYDKVAIATMALRPYNLSGPILYSRMEGSWYTKATARIEMPSILLTDWHARAPVDTEKLLDDGLPHQRSSLLPE
jgi:hypothetical protein